MEKQSKKQFSVYISIPIAVFLVLKLWYRAAVDLDILFLLSPTSFLVECFTSAGSTLQLKGGYFFPILNISIDKSCSGFNLLLIIFLMLSIAILPYCTSHLKKFIAIAGSFLAAYLSTILINTSRILISLFIEPRVLTSLHVSSKIIHESIGITTNLFGLILIYVILQRLQQKFFGNE